MKERGSERWGSEAGDGGTGGRRKNGEGKELKDYIPWRTRNQELEK